MTRTSGPVLLMRVVFLLLAMSTCLARDRLPSPKTSNTEVAPSPSQARDEEKEKFIWPLLSDFVGAGNQLMEYMSAAAVAHALNRTLCLSPFQEGPSKHFGLVWRNGHGLAIEERYDVEQLSKFVRVASVDKCLKTCNRKLDATWFLRSQRRGGGMWDWDKDSRDQTWAQGRNFRWSFVSWTSMTDIKNAFGESNLTCVALGGLFPGLRWRGAYLAVAAYLVTAPTLAASASTLQRKTFGLDTKFIAVHWRFEESFCGGRELGSCFLRCGDGAIVATRLKVEAEEWKVHEAKMKECHFHGVRVTKEDMVAAIYDRATEIGVNTVYLATDGWIRGKEGSLLIKQTVELLRETGIQVIGLWRIAGLPNFPDGEYIPPPGPKLLELFGIADPQERVSNRLISGVEQELCSRAEVFLGSGQSTWSLAVFRARLANRRARAILKNLKGDLTEEQIKILDQSVHNQIIEELLKDEHEAGLLCGYSRQFSRVRVNVTIETFEDEKPDGWLDLEACELRVGKGGKCEFATCT